MPVESAVPAPPVRKEAAPSARVTVGRAVWTRLSPYWPAAAVSALLLVLMAVFVRRSLALNDGHLVYPMDDAYSHMAIAKNLYRHGLWSFSSIDGFSSGGSSLLWPVLLAGCYAIFGMHDWAPLALNIIPAVAFIFYAGAVIRRHTLSGWTSLAILLAVLYFTPLPILTAVGMEHCWQILICLGFIDLSALALAADTPPGLAARARGWLPVMAFLMTMVRYEGLFLLGVVGLLLLYQRRWLTTALCAVAGALPIGAFGVFALSKGWHFFPNSLLLKAGVPPLSSLDGFLTFITRGFDNAMYGSPHILMLVLGLVGALLVQWRRGGTLWNRPTLLLTMLLAGTALHLQFAGLGWFFRYEGYLLGLGVLTVGLAVVDEAHAALAASPTWFERSQRLALLAVAVLFFAAPMWARAAKAWGQLAPASHNIYEQQFQMAQFVRQSYRGQGVAVNDIGAVDYFADIGLVDLWGLGTMEVTQAKLDHTYSRATVRGLLKKRAVQLIMIYPGWSYEYGGLPPEWVPVGQWTMPNNIVCGDPTVWFYAPNATLVPKLTEALRAYSRRLPPDILQTGFYCGEPLPHVGGVYAPEKDGGGIFYWTNESVQFALYPSDAREDAADVDATLLLSTRTMSKDVSLDVTVNGTVVATHRYALDEVGRWIDWPVRVRWREGFNTVNVMAHGGVPKMFPGDPRQLLFAIHEPKWTFDDKPEEVYPLPPPKPSPPDAADAQP